MTYKIKIRPKALKFIEKQKIEDKFINLKNSKIKKYLNLKILNPKNPKF